MLAKKTSKNQLTLPKAVVANYPDVEYFDVRDEDGRIVLVPLRGNQAEAVREKLEQLGIRDEDIDAAVRWARSR
jgi:bifunctional DNA-binding transcriptional regulator/antitoxin component of YhaV-PrlF toxin-antitoxin module